MLDTFKVLTCAATYQEFFKLEYLESSWLCISLDIIATHTNKSISKIYHNEEKMTIWREDYDQHLAAHISQQGYDLYEISDNYKDEKNQCVLTGLESLLLFTYKTSETISIHIFITPSSPASQPVPSKDSFFKIFFLRFIIRKNSLKISNISFFHISIY